MGWLNTLLDVGILSMQVSQREKLQQLQQQQADAALVQIVLQTIRDQVFKYKQAAEEILALEETNPKAAAAAMRILHLQLQEFGITPDMLPEISDKEYVASTTKLIRDNSNRLMDQLPSSDQTRVKEAASAATNLPKYIYYTENYVDAKKYKEASVTYNKLKNHNNGCVTGCGGCALIYLSVQIIGGICIVTGSAISETLGVILGSVGVLLGVTLGIAGVIAYRKKIAKPQEYEAAKTIVEEFDGEIDIEYFDTLEQELDSDYNQVVELRRKAQTAVEEFFGDSDLPPMLIG